MFDAIEEKYTSENLLDISKKLNVLINVK